MTAIFNNTMKTVLSDGALLDNAQVEMVMFPVAAALRPDQEVEGGGVPIIDSPYAAIDTVAGLEASLGWGPSITQRASSTLGTSLIDGTTHFALMNNTGFILPPTFPSSQVKVVAFVYKGPTSTAGGYATLPGTTGNYLSVPDAAPLDIVGDICIVACLALDDWTPTTNQAITSKWNADANFDRSWLFLIQTDGSLRFDWAYNASGGMNIAYTAPGVISAANGQKLWVGVTLDVNNGSSISETRFWTSPNGTTWTQLGTTFQIAGVTTINNSSVSMMIGDDPSGTSIPLAGKVHHVSVRNAIGASGVIPPSPGANEVFRFDGLTNLVGVTPVATTFTASTGQTVTISRSGGAPSTSIVQPFSVIDKVMFITDTPVTPPIVMHAGDGIIAQEDPSKGRILLSWASDSVIEGPLVRMVGPAPFEPARTQHLWIYPQRTNMIANPSFEEDVTYWRPTGSQITTKTACTVKAATTINLAALSAPQTIDTVSCVATDRVLVKDQTLPQNNGVYVVAAGAWTRATDADTAAELTGLQVYVKNGTQRGETWTCQPVTPPAVVVGTTPLPFVRTQTASTGTGNFAGHFVSKIVESNMFPLISRLNESGWTFQMRVRSDGEVKVGFIAWENDFLTTAADWGNPEEIWLPNNGWLSLRTCRGVGEASTGMLRVETQGTYIDLDMVCVEFGTMPANYSDWPYFDGDSLYGVDGDYSWYERDHKSYSCWYNNRSAVLGRLFAWNVSSQDALPGGVFTDTEAQTQGLAHQWVPAGTPLEYHIDVLYPEDPKNALPPVTGSVLPRKVGNTPATGVVTPWIAREAAAGAPGTWGPSSWTAPAPTAPEDFAALRNGRIKAYPITPWTTGQYVQTQMPGVAGRGYWGGSDWVQGVAK